MEGITIENKNFGLLITTSEDVSLLNQEKFRSFIGIASEYPLIQIHKEHNFVYFLDYDQPKFDLHNLVGKVASGWHKDNSEIDIIRAKDFSIGALLNYRLMIEFSSAVRYYFAFKESVHNYEKILVPNNSTKSLRMTAELFTDKVQFYSNSNSCNDHITSAPHRGAIVEPPVYETLSKFLRIFQLPFVKHLKNKILVFNDWTFNKIDNQNCLNINKFNPLKTFCLRRGSEYTKSVECVFPCKLDDKVIKSNIRRELLELDINRTILDDLVGLFVSIISEEYAESRQKLINTHCACLELFDQYNPSMVIVPGYVNPYYQTIYSIARSRGIPTVYIQDGYSIYLDKYLLPKDTHEKKYKIDFFAVMGEYAQSLYENILGNNIISINILPPVVNTHKIIKNKKEGMKSVIVMFPYGLIHSPYCRWDQKYKYVIDVVNTLKSLGHKNIKIKIKRGHDQYKEQENKLMRELLDKCDYEDVEMIFGEFSNYLQNAEFIVGNMGTAIIESIFRHVPFYVYEPFSLGMSDEFIKKSVIIESNQISRDLVNLKKSIYKHNFVSLRPDKIFGGADIKDVDFNEIAKNFAQ